MIDEGEWRPAGVCTWPRAGMNWNDLLAALALVLVIEGILPFLNPAAYKNTMMQLATLPESTLRKVGLGSMLAGVVFLYLIRG